MSVTSTAPSSVRSIRPISANSGKSSCIACFSGERSGDQLRPQSRMVSLRSQAHAHDAEECGHVFPDNPANRDRAVAGDRHRRFPDDRGTLLAYRVAAAYLAFVFYRSVAGEMQKLEDVATKPKEILVATVTRTFQGNRNSLFDSSRTLRHDD